MTKRAVLLVILGIASLPLIEAASVTEMVLEFEDVQDFSLTQKQVGTSVDLELSGLAFHSSLAAEKMTTESEGHTLVVRVLLVPARRGLSGRFSYTLRLPHGITRVVFGDRQHQIWPSQP